MNYGTSTRLSPEHVLQAAERFFGPPGLGLSVEERWPDRMQFAGEPGMVSVSVQCTDGATEVYFTTGGLDSEVRQFMVQIFEEGRQERDV